jgi:hypothetical protein
LKQWLVTYTPPLREERYVYQKVMFLKQTKKLALRVCSPLYDVLGNSGDIKRAGA